MDAGRYRRTDPCVVEDCPNTIDRTGLGICEAHYYRLRRHGRLGETPPRPRGTPLPRCSQADCPRAAKGLGLCDLHYQRLRKHGDPTVVKPKSQPGEANPYWHGGDVTYSGAHQRVQRARGPASAHLCALGCGRQAAQWSFLREDASLMPFSPDPSRYRPLCVPCHKRYDLHALTAEGVAHKPIVCV